MHHRRTPLVAALVHDTQRSKNVALKLKQVQLWLLTREKTTRIDTQTTRKPHNWREHNA